MKNRNGFVSNSSSSSFICDICGSHEEGFDLCVEDAAMFQCVNGHTICLEHLTDEVRDVICDPQLDEEGYEERADLYEVPADYCPFCKLEMLPESFVMKHYFDMNGISAQDVAKQIATKYKTLSDVPNCEEISKRAYFETKG